MSWILDNYYFKVLAVDFGVQWIGWALSSYLQTERFYDLTGAATFVSLAYLSLSWSKGHLRQTVLSNMVMAWAIRLGSFLFVRILKDGKDKRFDGVRDNPRRLFMYWNIQGVWIFVSLLPTLMLNHEDRDRPISSQDHLGWTLWAVGMLFEIVADLQKSMFKRDKNNEGKFIRTGLWAVSRHPNYFGEILLWFGLYISAASVFRGPQYLAVLSPVWIHLLITRVSGIPMLEKAGKKKWGHLPEYQEYLRNTAPLVPFLKTH